MSTPPLETAINSHPFFFNIAPRYRRQVCECAVETRFEAGAYIFHAGEPASQFYLLSSGKVALEINAAPRGPLLIDTLESGDVLGWSWLFSPYIWHFDARALLPTHAIEIDGTFLRVQAQQDHQFGYELMMRFTQILIERLQATRIQLLDIYNTQT